MNSSEWHLRQAILLMVRDYLQDNDLALPPERIADIVNRVAGSKEADDLSWEIIHACDEEINSWCAEEGDDGFEAFLGGPND